MADLKDSLDVVAWLVTALAAVNWGLDEWADINLLTEIGLSGDTLGLAYLAIGVLGVVDLALLAGKLDSGIVGLDQPVGLLTAVGTGVAAINWGTVEVLDINLLSDLLGLTDPVLSYLYLGLAVLGVLSLYWLAEDLGLVE
jgi:uncharacterized membrane protein YuzA (DUF378 family)